MAIIVYRFNENLLMAIEIPDSDTVERINQRVDGKEWFCSSKTNLIEAVQEAKDSGFGKPTPPKLRDERRDGKGKWW